MKSLSERDRLCFRCPLPDCYPNSPRCLWHRYQTSRSTRKRNWDWLYELVAEAETGETRALEFSTWKDMKCAQVAMARVRNETGREARTWSTELNNQYLLFVEVMT